MKNLNFILLLLVAISMFSCKKNDDNPAISALIPLKTGNTWTYVDSTFHTSYVNVDTSILSIGDFVNIVGSSGFKMNSFDNSFHITFLGNNDEAGNFINIGGYSDKDTTLTSSIQYKKDAKKGDSWIFQEVDVNPENGIFQNIPLTMTCLNADTTIVTKIGQFKCKVFSYTPDNGRDVMYHYISEGIGVIKSTHFEDNKLFATSTIIAYKLK